MRDGIALAKTKTPAGSRLADYFELTKPRITLMVVLTGAMGYYLASASGLSLPGLLHVVIGTALTAAGASVLNQVREKDADGRMTRTAHRAIPTGRISSANGLRFGVGLGVAGTVYIFLTLNPVTALLAAATIASYVLVYTPLKRTTPLNTLVGAVPGALPPVGGWAAATGGSIGVEAWALFTILFLWQIPHFLSLAWLLRNDYRRGGFRMLPVVDPDGRSTGIHVLTSAAALVPAAVLPTLLGMSGTLYLGAALAFTLAYAGTSAGMALRPGTARARRVFVVSILYLPALMGALLLDRLVG